MSSDLPANPSPSPPEELGARSLPEPWAAHPAVETAPHWDQGIDWRRYLAALARYKWLTALVTLLGTGGGFLVARAPPSEYVAQATIWIESRSRGDAGRGPIQSSELLQSYAWVELLRSYVILDSVVTELRLYLRPESPADSTALASFSLKPRFVPGSYRLEVDDAGKAFTLSSGGRVLQRGALSDSIGAGLGFSWVPPAGSLSPGRTVEFSVLNPRDAAARLAGDLRTRMAENGTFLQIELKGSNPELLAATLNTLAERYVEVAGELKADKLQQITVLLDDQVRSAERELAESEAGLEGFRVATVTLPSEPATPLAPGLQATRDPVFANFFEMKIEGERLRRDREEIVRALDEARTPELSVATLEVIPSVQRATELRQALANLTDKRAELRALRNRYTDAHRSVESLRKQIESLEHGAIPALASSLVTELSTREREIQRLVDSASGELRQIPPRAIEEARLTRAVEIAKALYIELRKRYQEAQLAEASSIPDVRILDRAAVPHQPVNRKAVQRIILMAFLASLGAGVLGAILFDRVDPRLRYPNQVTQELGVTILGAVPHLKSGNGPPGRQETGQVIEAFRSIRLSLAHVYGAAGPIVLTVTSPGSGDGKSFVACNLALAFADLGHRSILVDGDIRRGILHEMLKVPRKPGLTDYLSGQASREEIVCSTTSSAIHLVGSGTRMQRGPELLASAAMLQLLTELRSLYSVIIVDSPPLGAGADAYTLGTITGNLVLVLRTGTTNRELAEAKIELLDRLPIRLLGAVLNDVQPRGVYRYYRYLSGYESQDETPETRRQLVTEA